jgi:hypothetical protein
MKKSFKRTAPLWVAGAVLFCFLGSGVARGAYISQRLYSELLSFKTDGKIIELYDVPCLKIYLKKGQSISYFCRFVPYFDHNFKFYRQQIALINRIEPMAEVGVEGNLSTNVNFIYVPLNFSIRPKILPDQLDKVSKLPKYILVDLDAQCLGLYEYGKLIHQFPISSGIHGTPARKFVILSKDKDHHSTKYFNAWMPYALRLFGDYYLHAGILPSYAASHGCVRLIYENAIVVYNWAQVGTPGEIIYGGPKHEETQKQPPQPQTTEQEQQTTEQEQPDRRLPPTEHQPTDHKIPPTDDYGPGYRDLFVP